ncbi:hypothetical protein [Azospirillum sp. B2RO_4]|uniref:hypothetical protein n=1 Tax=Azospirillum sp. B2RO_4 TaxID=3027796 RepID=UPI003DA9CE6E
MSSNGPSPESTSSPPSPGMRLVAAGLYEYSAATRSADTAGQVVWVYFLLAADSSPSNAPLTLAQAWQTELGWYLISNQPIPDDDSAAFVTTARGELLGLLQNGGTGDPVYSAIVWLADPSALSSPPYIQIQRFSPSVSAAIGSNKLSAGGLSIVLSQEQSSSISLLEASPDIGAASVRIFADVTASDSISLCYDNAPQQVWLPNGGVWSVALALAGPGAGSLVVDLALDPGGLYAAFDCAITYFYSAGGGGSLTYPVFPSVAPGESMNTSVAFELRLNPVRPLDAAATGLLIDRAGRFDGQDAPTPSQPVLNARALQSTVFFANDGSPMVLTPWDPLEEGGSPSFPAAAPLGGGFAFSQGMPPDPCYLSPVGAFLLPASSPATGQLMPGLFAREFLRLAPDDLLIFVNNQPACAIGFPSGGSPGTIASSPPAGPLTDDATTSWAMVMAGDGAGDRGYFGQSSGASFFGPPPTLSAVASPFGELGVATTVDLRLSVLDTPVAFPVAPYGALFATDAATGQPFNPQVDPVTVTLLESLVLSQLRHQALADSPQGPVVLPVDARVPSADIAAVATPQGLLIDVNPDGTWSRITLAMGSGQTALQDNALRFNGIGSPPRVAPSLATLLTRDQLFLVVDTAADDWGIQNLIAVGGFEFSIDLTGGESPSILIFKFNTRQSLHDLALDPTNWAEPTQYAPNTAATVARLQQAFRFAQDFDASGDGTFEAFNALLQDPQWTGVIAFSVPINGNGMPSDLQMLLGGIPGALQAHHIGVQTNKLAAADGGRSFDIVQSSVFSVIVYERQDTSPPAAADATNPDYDVDVLIAVISNSAIAELTVKVSLVLPALFGRAITLTPEPASPGVPQNAITIQGQYQQQGSVGRVSFTTSTPFDFEFVRPQGQTRILERVLFTGASLVPVTGTTSADASPGQGRVVADFVLNGSLYFREAPFPGVELDLFSYGTPGSSGTGLQFNGLTVRIAFTLDQAGVMVPDSKTVTLLMETLKPQPGANAIRPQSLMASLPLKYTNFLMSGPGAAAIGTGAQTVNVLQLAPSSTVTGSPPLPPGGLPATTTSPIFGLQYQMSLGSLGSLSGAHGDITASLILGWGPAPSLPDNDAATVLVQLPSLSAGYAGFDLQGILRTTFGDANLLKVDLDDGSQVYALLFGNIQLSVFGYRFPPGILVDFLLFAGSTAAASPGAGNTSNIAWLLSATTDTGES